MLHGLTHAFPAVGSSELLSAGVRGGCPPAGGGPPPRAPPTAYGQRMRSRGQSPAHAEAVSRRLALLSAELQGYRGARADDTPTGARPTVDPEVSEGDVEDAWSMGELVPFPQEEAHTRIRRTAEQLPAETPEIGRAHV